MLTNIIITLIITLVTSVAAYEGRDNSGWLIFISIAYVAVIGSLWGFIHPGMI